MIKLIGSGNYLSDTLRKEYIDAVNEVDEYVCKAISSIIGNNGRFVKSIARFKSMDSLCNKIFRKNLDFSDGNICSKITDIVGARYVFGMFFDDDTLDIFDKKIESWDDSQYNNNILWCSQSEQNNCQSLIFDIAKYLQNNKNGDSPIIIEENDYITNPKKSGYKSYHIVFKASNGVLVEAQLRTLLQHLWSVREHKVVYEKLKQKVI